jgi:heptosyltransferase-2
LEPWLARIPERIGYGVQGRRLLLTRPVGPRADAVVMHKRSPAGIRRAIAGSGFEPSAPHPPRAHHIHQYLHLVADGMGASSEPLAPSITLGHAEVSAALGRFNLLDGPDAALPRCGLNPGAEYGPAKRWPVDRWVGAIREIDRQIRCQWILFGGPGDRALAAAIAAALDQRSAGSTRSTAPGLVPVLNLAAATRLRELAALLSTCRVLLTNDTGPMHLAAAVGTPVVVPFGSTDPSLTGPGLPGSSTHALLRASVPCAPCFRRVCPIDFRCMKAVGVPDVVAAAVRILRR